MCVQESVDGKFVSKDDSKRLKVLGRKIKRTSEEIADLKELHLDALGKLQEVDHADHYNVQWYASTYMNQSYTSALTSTLAFWHAFS